jgi:hypothetical protein
LMSGYRLQAWIFDVDASEGESLLAPLLLHKSVRRSSSFMSR